MNVSRTDWENGAIENMFIRIEIATTGLEDWQQIPATDISVTILSFNILDFDILSFQSESMLMALF